MGPITKEQISIIHTLLSQFGKLRGEIVSSEEKAEMVMNLSRGRATSTKDLNVLEAQIWIHGLKEMVADPVEKSAERMRRHIIAMAHEMGWETLPAKIDMDRVNNWVAKFGYLNKTHHTLNQYSYKELPQLVTQFKKVYQSFLKSI